MCFLPFRITVMKAGICNCRYPSKQICTFCSVYTVRGVCVAKGAVRRNEIQGWYRWDPCRGTKPYHLSPGHAWSSQLLLFSYLLRGQSCQKLNHNLPQHQLYLKNSFPFVLTHTDHESIRGFVLSEMLYLH